VSGANDLLSDEHFSVDGTLIEAWASQKSFQRKDQGPTPPPEDPGNPTIDFHGEERTTTRMHRQPIQKQGWHEKVEAMSPSWPIAATC